MKNLQKYLAITFLTIGLMLTLTYCNKHDQIINPNPTPVATVSPGVGDTLFSIKTSTAPVFVTGGAAWSGPDASLWANAPKTTETVVVPDVEGSITSFAGFIGNSNTVTMQSMYDATNIYFLIQWNQKQPNMESSPWYFNPTTHLWVPGGAAPTYDVNGNLLLESLVSDQFDVAFNINNSCADFASQSCYGLCHQGVTSMVVDTVTGNVTFQTNNVMHTSGPSEKIDCWRARMYQVMGACQALDYYIDWEGGLQSTNAVHADQSVSNGANPPVYSSNASTNGTGGVSNKQSLTITGKTTKMSVPIWVKTSTASGTYVNAALIPSDTNATSGPAFKVVAVDSNGVLTLSGSGGTINPNIGTAYQQVGTGIGTTNDQTTWIPGKVIAPYTGGEGDVAANAHWTGTGWQLMLKRALKTSDILIQDVDFSPLTDIQFGIGLMYQPLGSPNAADNEHAIKAGMLLHFK